MSLYYGSLLVVIVCDQLITKYRHAYFLILAALVFFGSLGLGWGLGLGFVFELCLCL
jgi:hypothetical protein